MRPDFIHAKAHVNVIEACAVGANLSEKHRATPPALDPAPVGIHANLGHVSHMCSSALPLLQRVFCALSLVVMFACSGSRSPRTQKDSDSGTTMHEPPSDDDAPTAAGG